MSSSTVTIAATTTKSSPSKSPGPSSPALIPRQSPDKRSRKRSNSCDKSSSSMTLAISRKDATRMLEASRSFNLALNRLRGEERQRLKKARPTSMLERRDLTSNSGGCKDFKQALPTDPATESLFSDRDEMKPVKEEEYSSQKKEAEGKVKTEDIEETTPTASKLLFPTKEPSKPSTPPSPALALIRTPLHKLLRRSAIESQSPLLKSFVRRMERDCNSNVQELETSLLLFLDVDKSSKLLTAFGVLGADPTGNNSKDTEEVNGHGVNIEEKNVATEMSVESEEEGVNQNENETKAQAVVTNDNVVAVKKEEREDISNEKDGTTEDSKLGDTPLSDGEGNFQVENDGLDDEDDDDEIGFPPNLSYVQMMTLFKCFLTSISTCIHHEQPSHSELSTETDDEDDKKRGISVAVTQEEDDHMVNSMKSASKVAKESVYSSPYSSSPWPKPPAAGKRQAAGNKSTALKNNCLEKGELNDTDNRGLRDWALSDQTKREIYEIAIFATDRLMDHVVMKERKKRRENEQEHDDDSAMISNNMVDSEGLENEDDDTLDITFVSTDPVISFESFGEWYNMGGFSLVPWLELLDLAKWDYAGRAAAAAAAAATASEKARRTQERENYHRDGTIESIVEESSDSAMKESSSSVFSLSDRQEHNHNASLADAHKAVETFAPSPNLFFENCDMDLSVMDQRLPECRSRTVVSFDFTGGGVNDLSSNLSPPINDSKEPFDIKITEENLRILKILVQRTELLTRSPEYVGDIILRHSVRRAVSMPSLSSSTVHEDEVLVLHRENFGRCVRDLVPPEAFRKFDHAEMENFSDYFTNFFNCFTNMSLGMGSDYANAKELAVGFSFLCAGNKSTKLATAFEMLDETRSGYLTQRGLTQYLRSYLTMLVGISLLSSNAIATAETRKILFSQRKDEIFDAVENGAKWTLKHLIRAFDIKHRRNGSTRNNAVTFEDFAEWYTEGGYTVAPWLELLDLTKFLTLLNDNNMSQVPPLTATTHPLNSSTPDRSHQQENMTSNRHTLSAPSAPIDILFTFPLANRKSLVVLREDASYVRTVVKQIGLLSMTPEEVWNSLYSSIQENPAQPLSRKNSQHHKSGIGKSMDVDQSRFVRAMEQIIIPNDRLTLFASAQDTLNNFFQSFDLDQVDRVAANQLMGGLTLLCGGKKSTKLAFSFKLFDGRTNDKPIKPTSKSHSLDGKELFLFFRSFLIVMFSCCKQSLDLSAEAVSCYISDTAHMVAEDVMRYQWQIRRLERVDFDEFGEWYNEGGFETAPWLELLDLKKWVLVDYDASSEISPPTPNRAPGARAAPTTDYGASLLESPSQRLGDDTSRQLHRPHEPHKRTVLKTSKKIEGKSAKSTSAYDCPSPPPDDAIDPNTDDLFGDEMNMEGIDDMDFILGEGTNKANGGTFLSNDTLLSPKLASSNSAAHSSEPSHDRSLSKNDSEKNQLAITSAQTVQVENSLKFHLLTSDNNKGYMISIGPQRVRLLKHLVSESNLYKIDVTAACDKIISQASTSRYRADGGQTLSKADFDAAMRDVIRLANDGKMHMSPDTQRQLSDLLTSIYESFDVSKTGDVDAKELACGFTVLCGGRKSDKLEFAFELLDKDNDGRFSRNDMTRYLQSFLTVLLSISACPIGREPAEDILWSMEGDRCPSEASLARRVIGLGSSWATSEVFGLNPGDHKQHERGRCENINFDDFADWYTKGGYISIPWLELLDLRKWVLADIL